MDMENELSKVERINLIIDEELDILKLSFTEQMSIIWGWFWRSFVLMLAIGSVSSGAGLAIGFLGSLFIDVMNMDIVQNQIYLAIAGGIIGFCISLYSYVYLIKWVTQRNIGKFRFILIRKV